MIPLHQIEADLKFMKRYRIYTLCPEAQLKYIRECQRLSEENEKLKQVLKRISTGWTIREADELSDLSREALSAIDEKKEEANG